MGCDYYRGTFLTIVYLDKNKQRREQIIQLDRVACYFGNNFDRDFMTTGDYFEKQIEYYPNKDLFKDGEWLCLKDSSEKYKNIIEKIEDFDSLLYVYKSTDFWER